jgi:hypothetical protein
MVLNEVNKFDCLGYSEQYKENILKSLTVLMVPLSKFEKNKLKLDKFILVSNIEYGNETMRMKTKDSKQVKCNYLEWNNMGNLIIK